MSQPLSREEALERTYRNLSAGIAIKIILLFFSDFIKEYSTRLYLSGHGIISHLMSLTSTVFVYVTLAAIAIAIKASVEILREVSLTGITNPEKMTPFWMTRILSPRQSVVHAFVYTLQTVGLGILYLIFQSLTQYFSGNLLPSIFTTFQHVILTLIGILCLSVISAVTPKINKKDQ